MSIIMAKQQKRVEFSNNVANEIEIINEDTEYVNHQQQKQHVEFSKNVYEIENVNEDTEDASNPNVSNKSLNKRLVFGAMFCFKFLGIINYISDVGSDIGNGYEYLRTQTKWPRLADNSSYNYTRELCDNWESYRHVKMGTLTLSIVFIPSALAVVFLGVVYLARNLSSSFRIAHDRVRVGMGQTAENSKLVRLTNWVEYGTCQEKALKGILLFFILCIFFCIWQLIVVFILVNELYYLYTLSEYRIKRDVTRPSSDKCENGSRSIYKKRQSEVKIDLNKNFFQSFSMLLRITEMCTESILQLIVQVYIAIYNDFKPGPIQLLSMSTSFVSLVLGTFYWNSDFTWDRKYRDGLKAVPLYILSIAYKCLSVTTMIAVMSYYSSVPLGLLAIVLAVIYYRLISDDITKNVFNVLAVYMSMVTQNTLYQRRDMFQADDIKYLKWFLYEALVSTILHGVTMLILCILWTNEDHQLFVNLNECAQNSLKYKFPYICIGITCMALAHFILTLIYVGYFPHVWKLDPKRRCRNGESRHDSEADDIQDGMMPMPNNLAPF